MHIPFVVSGPSGVGKATVIHQLRPIALNLPVSISYTTRSISEGEQAGIHYHFVTRDTFERMRALGDFIEHAEYAGNLYGTSREESMRLLQTHDVLFEIDQVGALKLKQVLPNAVLFFIQPPSFEELERRLRARKRSNLSEQAILDRLEIAREEIAHADRFDYQVVNDDPARAAREILDHIRNIRIARTSVRFTPSN